MMTRVISLLLLLLLLAVSGCNLANSTSTTPTVVPAPTYTHTTIRPSGDEASFILKPNSGYSVVLSLEANQYLRANFIFSPTDHCVECMRVCYTYPEGTDVSAGGHMVRSFETQPGHPEGYYSIDFYYDIPRDAYIPDLYRDVHVYVHWEVLSDWPQ